VVACLDAERPPGLGVDQAQPVPLMTFVSADDRDMVMALPRDMRVNTALRAFYWKEVKSFTEMTECMTKIGHRLLEFYVLKDGAAIAQSRLIESDGPHEYAWFSCMVVEAFGNGHRIAFAPWPRPTTRKGPDGKQLVIDGTRFNGR
jgi:hypothetical protein